MSLKRGAGVNADLSKREKMVAVFRLKSHESNCATALPGAWNCIGIAAYSSRVFRYSLKDISNLEITQLKDLTESGSRWTITCQTKLSFLHLESPIDLQMVSDIIFSTQFCSNFAFLSGLRGASGVGGVICNYWQKGSIPMGNYPRKIPRSRYLANNFPKNSLVSDYQINLDDVAKNFDWMWVGAKTRIAIEYWSDLTKVLP